MDTLSSSVSSFKFPTTTLLHSSFSSSSTSHHPTTHPHLSSIANKVTNYSIPNEPTRFTAKCSHNRSQLHKKNFSNGTAPPSQPRISSSSSKPLSSGQPRLFFQFHRKASSGYAAALIDAARCNGSLESVAGDARRFGKLLSSRRIGAAMADPLVDEIEKGRLVKEAIKKGGFHGHLAVLLRMLVERGKLGLLGEVLSEFERIYDELCGTSVALVSPAVSKKLNGAPTTSFAF